LDASVILGRLARVRRSGSGWVALCPAHEDRAVSLSIGVGDDGCTLLHCHAGCSTEAVVASLGFSMADLFAYTCDARAIPSNGYANLQTLQPSGCTLAAYAAAKGLDEAFLCSLGVADATWPAKRGRPAVRIPYRDADGVERSVRYRVGPSGSDRFRWRSRSKPMLYGLERLGSKSHTDTSGERGVALVEGESDCHTLWQAGFGALGLPGAASWREAWANEIDGIDAIFIVIEPDDGGAAVLRWLANSAIRDRARLVRLDSFKDPSELYLADREHFRQRWRAALDTAVPFGEFEKIELAARTEKAWRRCAPLAREPRILDRFAESVSRVVAGEERIVKVLYLALTSRLLDNLVSVAVKGPSSGGKSWTVEQVLAYFPPDAYHALSAMSEHALAYGDEPLSHRFLVLYEAAALDGDFASYLLRSLLSEGRVRYETVEKTSEGLRPKLIEREGPTGLLVTTTAVSLHPENETRLLSLTVTDSPAQTRAVLSAIAKEHRISPDLSDWLALQTWLAACDNRVTIPFADRLAGAFPVDAVRFRRDFGAVLNLIRAHALLHQASRERDQAGWIVASLDDYRVVRDLVEDLVADGAGLTVSATVRETVEGVICLGAPETGVTVSALASHMQLDQSAAWRRVQVAVRHGHLRNLEDRPRRPARLVLGDPLPDERPIMPEAESLQVCASIGGGDAHATAGSVDRARGSFDLSVEQDYPPGAWDVDAEEDDPQASLWLSGPLPAPAGAGA
jgi:hypothetical protein